MEKSHGRGSAEWAPGAPVLLLAIMVLISTPEAVEGSGVQHQVGGPPGWSLPSIANVNYTTWASTQSFQPGDSLYFNYSSVFHNVLEVSAAKYEACDASNPLGKWDDGATVISLNSSGTSYYICGIPGHCDAGQKVAVQVAEVGKQHQVGGTPGWSLPSMSNVNYTDWASTQTFVVGDKLYFNYSSAYHNVLEVTKAKYDSCDASSPLAKWTDGATIVPLNKTGTRYFICGVPGHCNAGQKVAVLVVATASTPTPTQAPSSSSSNSSPSSASPSAPSPASSSPLSVSTNPISSLLITLVGLSLMTFLVFP